MTLENQTSTRSRDDIRIFAPWAYSLFTIVLVTVAVLFVTLVRMDPKAPPLCDPMPVGPPRRSRARLLCRADRLHQPGRWPPRHEPPALDADRHLCPQRPRHRPLFCTAQAPRGHMSAMQCRSRARFQLLPPLPPPPAPRLPTLPAQRRPGRQILPLLRRGPRVGQRLFRSIHTTPIALCGTNARFLALRVGLQPQRKTRPAPAAQFSVPTPPSHPHKENVKSTLVGRLPMWGQPPSAVPSRTLQTCHPERTKSLPLSEAEGDLCTPHTARVERTPRPLTLTLIVISPGR